MTNYLALKMTCTEDFREVLIAELSVLNYDTFMETDEGFEAYITEDVFDEAALKGLMERYGQAASASYSTERIVERNWNEEWEKNYEPIIVGEECIVKATFHQVPQPYPYELIINPQMAFGTGHHATTHLMLSYQLELDHSGQRVLDIGTGTGVLAIMALKRGAAHVEAFDNNDWAVNSTQENAALNNVSFPIALGTVTQVQPQGPFDLVLANINRNVLLDEMSHYAALMAPGATLLLSGFYDYDTAILTERAEEEGLHFVDKKTRNNWASLRLQRR